MTMPSLLAPSVHCAHFLCFLFPVNKYPKKYRIGTLVHDEPIKAAAVYWFLHWHTHTLAKLLVANLQHTLSQRVSHLQTGSWRSVKI
jgi:hypothetical protein